MKKNIILISILVVAASIFWGFARSRSSRAGEIDSLSVVLDRTIDNKAIYAQIRENRIDSLKKELYIENNPETKIRIVQRIFNLYFDFQNDLAMKYALMMREMAEEFHDTDPDYLIMAQLNMVNLLRFTGQLKDSADILDEISTQSLSPAVHRQYLTERMVTYVFLRDNSHAPEYKEYYDIMSEVYRDSLLANTPSSAGVIIHTERLLREEKPQKALELLFAEYNKVDPLSKRAGTLAYNMALCYEAMEDQQNFVLYLLHSAIADLHSAVRGYKSLQRLAVIMYEAGDIDRAYNYMKCSMEDAINSSARIRANEASEMFVVIDEAYQQKITDQKRVVTNFLVAIGIIGILLLISLFVISYQNKRIMVASNKLADANRVKEGYIGVFIEEYSNHLSRMNSYRMKSTKVLNTRNLDEIVKFVDKALDTNDDLKELYRKFDASILHVFPTFVEEFNMLMKDQDNNSSSGRNKSNIPELTAEQRIAAFIRLGIKETEKIALFLRYSVRTIYNYRSQMRAKAKSPADLENDIMRIGISNGGKKR